MNHAVHHWRNHWYFQRLDDGSVRIRTVRPIGHHPDASIIADIPSAEWASIVAAVSAAGETSENYHIALALHEAAAASGRAADTSEGGER